MSQILCELHYRWLGINNYARIPDEENTDGGRGRESDQSYAEIPDEENNEVPEPGGERRSVDKTDLTLDLELF